MTFVELIEKKTKTQAETMLCQAIASLSTQAQFEKNTPGEIFNFIEKTSQHWSKKL